MGLKDIEVVNVEQTEEDISNNKYAFKIKSTNETREYMLRANSRDERDYWVQVLHNAKDSRGAKSKL